jgi:hypothetical protein
MANKSVPMDVFEIHLKEYNLSAYTNNTQASSLSLFFLRCEALEVVPYWQVEFCRLCKNCPLVLFLPSFLS